MSYLCVQLGDAGTWMMCDLFPVLSQVRLENGGDHCRGRVELLYNNTWGWLSDKHWDRHGADVVCWQLGCGPSLEALKGDAFGPPSGNVLEQMDCTGEERDVSECLLGTWTEPDPTRPQHSAGVSCLSFGESHKHLILMLFLHFTK